MNKNIQSATNGAVDLAEVGTTAELVERARRFCVDCTLSIKPTYDLIKDSFKDRPLIGTVGTLIDSLDLTSENILFLLENNRLWDAPILLRSVIDGSAKCAYLLSAPSVEVGNRRLEEFVKILPQKEWASFEQPAHNMKHNFFGNNYKSPIFDFFYQIVQCEKTGPGDGKLIKEVDTRWRFWNLTQVMRRECPQWAELSDLFEFYYAFSNSLVHKSALGCQRLFEEAKLINGQYGASIIAYASPILALNALLLYCRLFLFARKAGLDVQPLMNVMQNSRDLFDKFAAIESLATRPFPKQSDVSLGNSPNQSLDVATGKIGDKDAEKSLGMSNSIKTQTMKGAV